MTTIPEVLKRWVEAVGDRLRGGARDERGAVAVIFAVSIVLLAPMALGIVDIYMTSSQRSRLQDALDAAALYTARSGVTSADEISATGLRALQANLSPADQARLVGTNFALTDSTVAASAEMSSGSIASELWNHGTMKVSTNVVRNSLNLEVSLVLDITGSMSGDMDDLKTSANNLIDLVVQDVQTPYYTKLAIVPYSNAVNVGSYAASVRGAIPAGKTITGATKANPVVITSNKHGFANGDYVYITGVSGMTQLNNNLYKVANKTTNTFQLQTTSGYNVDGRYYNTYSSGGSAYCTTYGCEYYKFSNAYNSGTEVYQISTCASERTGTYKYSDASPSTAYVGKTYPPSSGNTCPTATLTPLSTDKTSLKATITSLAAAGSTAGHIGIAWGWYMVSPNFGYLWPSTTSVPAAYGTDELLKVVVLMTDGDFNTAYCNGVIAQDSGSGSGSSSDHINCNATNGSSYTQAKGVCDAMKLKDVVVYTVGFRITSGSSAANLLSYCATDSKHEYLPSSGQDLQDAFKAIGQDINSLRLSH